MADYYDAWDNYIRDVIFKLHSTVMVGKGRKREYQTYDDTGQFLAFLTGAECAELRQARCVISVKSTDDEFITVWGDIINVVDIRPEEGYQGY